MFREFREYDEDKKHLHDDHEDRSLNDQSGVEHQEINVIPEEELGQRLTESDKAEINQYASKIIANLEEKYASQENLETHETKIEEEDTHCEIVKLGNDEEKGDSSILKEIIEDIDLENSQERVAIDSTEALDEFLDRHSHLCDYPGSKEVYRQARLYIELKVAQQCGALLDVTSDELSESFNIPSEAIDSWLSGKFEPLLIQTLKAHEKKFYQSEILDEEKIIVEKSAIKDLKINDSSTHHRMKDMLCFPRLHDNHSLTNSVREQLQIRDSTTLEIELDKFAHLRERPDFGQMRSVCDKYFKALGYQDALFSKEITISAIAATLEVQPHNIHRWLILDQKPRLLWLLNHERTRVAIAKCLHNFETQHSIPNDRLLRAAEDSEFRDRLLPSRTFSAKTVDRLLSLRNEIDKSLNPTNFTKISDLQIYQSALRAFPLVQEHPQFDTLHRQVKLYFLIRNDYPLHSEIKLPIDTIAQYVGVSEITIRSWRNETSRPRLLTLLENRATNLKIHQERLEKLRGIDQDLNSLQDIAKRLSPNHFIFGDIIRGHPSLPNYLKDAKQYLAFLALVEAGYHPHGLEIHFKLPADTISDILRYQHRPYLIRLAANIPDNPLAPGLRWLPTASDTKDLTARHIQVPSKITKYEQLFPILETLPNLLNPDSFLKNKIRNFGPSEAILKQWLDQFGPIQSLEEKFLAFGYLVGASLSDGYLKLESNFNSYFKIALSKKYPWSKTFGNRIAYYYTSIGIPSKPGNDLPPQKGDPYGAYQWYSCNSPFLTWFDQAVLGFKSKQTHTETPAKINWVFNAPRSFQIKVLQGLFDGDGWSNLPNRVIGIDSKQNQENIHLLLEKVGIKATKYDTEMLRIESKENIRYALRLPIFLSATGRLETANQIAQMSEAPRLVEPLCNRPLMRRILQLHDENKDLSPGRISVLIYREQGIVIGRNTISSLIEKGWETLTVDNVKIKTYFSLLEQYLQESDQVKYLLFRKVKDETGYRGSLRSMDHWLSGRIPFDVKLVLSDGYHVSKKLLDNFPQLNRYLPKRPARLP